MPFLTEPVIRRDGPQFWQLIQPLAYRGRTDVWIVPAGFRTDLASIPRAFRSLCDQAGQHTRAAILHDYLCRAGLSRSDVDGVFRRVLREDGVGPHRRWPMWAAVRVGSRMRDADRADWTGVLLVAAVAVPLLAAPALVNGVLLLLLRVLDALFPGDPQ